MEQQLQKVHEGYRYNRDMIWMTVPLFLMAFFFYGPRTWLLAAVGVLTARICDRVACAVRSRPYDKTENSSVPIALIVVLMMPATVRYRVVVAGVVMAVLVAKEAFGGYGSYPFNPSAVGFCLVAVSWPEEVLHYPQPQNWLVNLPPTFSQLLDTWRFQGASTVTGPSFTLRSGGLPNISIFNMLLGNFPGPLGVTCALVILSCVAFLLVRKRFSLAAPLAFIGAVALFAFLFPRYNVVQTEALLEGNLQLAERLSTMLAEIFSSAMVFTAVFMVNEPGTLPKNMKSRIVYGALLGVTTMLFRYYGIYELGACFAFLLVNAVSGFFDRALGKPNKKPAKKEKAPGKKVLEDA